MVLGLGVERLALLQLLLDKCHELLVALAFEQRALGLTHLQMAVEHLGRGLQIDHHALLVHVFHVVEEAGRAAAAADDDIFKLSHFVQHVALYLAETRFAHLGKYLRHRFTTPTLNIPVEVVKRDAQFFGKGLADSGLAGAHITNQNDSFHQDFLFVTRHLLDDGDALVIGQVLDTIVQVLGQTIVGAVVGQVRTVTTVEYLQFGVFAE